MTPELFRFGHEAMNAPFEVSIVGHKEEYAGSAAEEIFQKIDAIEQRLSKFVDFSDLNRISVAETGDPVVIAPDTMKCLLMALWVHKETSGAFDITIGKGIENLVLDPDNLTASLNASLKFDLGGIGKGFALDVAAELLDHWGVENALLAAGPSTILALGSEGDKEWSIGLNGKPLDLRDMALSSSGKDILGEHIINPRTGEKASGHEKAWVTCPSAAVADALSTAFMVMDTEEVQKFCEEHDGINAFLLTKNGDFLSAGS